MVPGCVCCNLEGDVVPQASQLGSGDKIVYDLASDSATLDQVPTFGYRRTHLLLYERLNLSNERNGKVLQLVLHASDVCLRMWMTLEVRCLGNGRRSCQLAVMDRLFRSW
jgi:hypothetical protein